jgi:hypothetical protein
VFLAITSESNVQPRIRRVNKIRLVTDSRSTESIAVVVNQHPLRPIVIYIFKMFLFVVIERLKYT